MIFCKKDRGFQRTEFSNSGMARDLLVSVPEEEPRIIVATSHFESLADMTFQREEQLTMAFAQMAKYEDAIIMGDTNILQIDGKV
jgi:hypothetical protein